MSRFAELLAHPDTVEECELRSRFGFMAYHGGKLEAMTDVIAREAAERSGASYYGLLFPDDIKHLTSTAFDPARSPTMSTFLDYVDVVVTIHGYGRENYWTTLLLGGGHRELADHVAVHLAEALPEYDVMTDLEQIPEQLRGLHPRNPVNLTRLGGVQIELPPRVRGAGMMWSDWDGPGLVPHTTSLIEGLVASATSWQSQTSS
jgi:phage replication-related protein YjqB (UPF0714/DUF867 family)